MDDWRGSRRTALRILLALVVVPSLIYTGLDIGLVSGGSSDASSAEFPETVSAAELDGATVIASQSGSLSVANSNGTTVARLSEHDSYFDVDLVTELGSATVLYAAFDHVPDDECPMRTACVRNSVETYNLTTGETRTLFTQITPEETAPEWHDADYMGDGEVIVADMSRDRVFIVNTSTDLIMWQWQAGQAFTLSTGGQQFQDWTHLNDVEVLEDGRIMVSMRNHDQVIFIDRERGVIESQTLGQDRDPSAINRTLYAQHNPDYIPAEQGGPSVLVADSERDRIVEFQRNGSTWEQTWEYGVGLGWPRDADRLPNGHTLITDSHNSRVIEINEDNEIVWEAHAPLPYEAERIGSGPESAGGQSATELGLSSATDSGGDDSLLGQVKESARRVLPDRVVNAVSFVRSMYQISYLGMATALIGVSLSIIWVVLEFRWSQYSLVSPVQKNREH